MTDQEFKSKKSVDCTQRQLSHYISLICLFCCLLDHVLEKETEVAHFQQTDNSSWVHVWVADDMITQGKLQLYNTACIY